MGYRLLVAASYSPPSLFFSVNYPLAHEDNEEERRSSRLAARWTYFVLCALISRFAISILTAWYGRYIPVRQVAGTRRPLLGDSAKNRLSTVDFDRRRSIEGRNQPPTVD
ncbi:hypothetical protein BHM03_00015647 [Ensete ventricosum]|nr:hypothetical protein BHM03_00015647 [Ensete ventricosum]